MDIINSIFSEAFFFSVIRVTTPILFAALGALISNKAGVINIGLEGIMLIAALTGVMGSAFTGSAFLGVLFAVIMGGFVGYFMSYCYLTLKTDIILVGIAVNLFAAGATVFILYIVTGDKGSSINLDSLTVPSLNIPFIANIPFIGKIISGHNLLTYIGFLSVFLVWVLIYKTTLGLRIRAVGESSSAASSVGINIRFIQVISLVMSGAITGLGGAYLSMGYTSRFSPGMTAGRGFIALGAEAMGNSTPFGIFLSSLLFGFADALANFLQALSLPPEVLQMFPYVITVIGLVIYSILRARKASKKVKTK